MPTFLHFVSFLVLSLFFSLNNLAFAYDKTFIKEYTYQASEQDSKISCRTTALTQVKRLLLEELGSYLESQSEVKNYQLTKDEIVALSSGIVKTQILDERWDGKNYWIKARLFADPEAVLKSIEANKNSIIKQSKLSVERQTTQEVQQRQEHNDFIFELQSCKNSGYEVTCSLLITNKEKDRNLTMGSPGWGNGVWADGFGCTRVIDASAEEYCASSFKLGNKSIRQWEGNTLVTDIPSKAVIRFKGISSNTTNLSLFEILCRANDTDTRGNLFKVQFRNISLTR